VLLLATLLASAGKIRVPKITVIMPTYNWSTVLPYSIGSVLMQRWTDFELLVIGDGCTDDSADVVARVGDPRVKWIGLPENSGHQSTPNNVGLHHAQGEIVAYLGHDDLWLPHHLECLVAAIEHGADLAYSICRWVSPDANAPSLFVLPRYRAGRHLPPSALAHRRAVTDRVGGWLHHGELREFPETDLWRRAYEAGFAFSFVPRLSVIKFPAGARSNVYRERPHYEQDAWLERIRSNPNLEIDELANTMLAVPQSVPYRDLVEGLWHETWRRLRRRLSSTGGRLIRAGNSVEDLRRIKGLDPASGRQVPADRSSG
jgi:glycosyltransferase involved in cell wall biosynthesis